MFKGIFSNTRPTSRMDVAMALSAAVLAAFKAWDTTNKYKAEQKALTEENN